MPGIKATVTTDTLVTKPELKKTRRRKRDPKKADLDNCRCCSKGLKAFVAADGARFCSDDCVKEYLA